MEGQFDLGALHGALDARRQALGLTWTEAVAQINAQFAGVTSARRIAASTVRGLRDRGVVEGDGVLQMLVWLGRSPESFVAGAPTGDPLPVVGPDRILRWDPPALHAALDERRRASGDTWAAVARRLGCSPSSLTGLASAQRVALPQVMRWVRWVDRPAATFTRASPH